MAKKKMSWAGPIKFKIPDKTAESFSEKNKSLIFGDTNKESALSFSNVVLKTCGDEDIPAKLEIDLTNVAKTDGELTIKLRKVQICDDNGVTADIYMLCSEAFNKGDGWNGDL